MKSITSSLNVRDLIEVGDEIILATGGGLAVYHKNSGAYNIFTRDHGLADTDLQSVHIGPKGLVWTGSDSGVQVWYLKEQKLLDWFQLDIEVVSGFVTYKDMVYGIVKNDGQWGIMEFIHSNDKVYYRDFYGRNDIGNIDDIVKFGDNLILLTNKGLLSGNPHKTHPLYWTNPFPGIESPVITIDQKNGELALVTSNAILSTKMNETPVPLVTGEKDFLNIRSIAVRGPLDFMAVTDSVIYHIGTDKFEKQFSDPGFHFSEIKTNGSKSIIGTSLGFAVFDGTTLNHVAGDEAIVYEPDVISFSQDQLIFAGLGGISVGQNNGWVNASPLKYSLGFSTKVNLDFIDANLGNGISEIISTEDGTVYLGLKESLTEGILILDITDGIRKRTTLTSPTLLKNWDNRYFIKDMLIDKKNQIWFISENEDNKTLGIYSGNNTKHFSFEESGGVLSKNSSSITADNFNRIWIGSPSGLTMYKYSGDVMNPTSEVWATETVDPGPTKRIPLDINVSSKNRLWVLTSIGLIHKDLQVSESNPVSQTGPIANNGEIYPYFPNVIFNENSRIRFDPRGNVWITSPSDGIHIVSENGEYWPDINGLNESNSNLLSNHVNDVTFDTDEGLAYIATAKGVSVIRIPFAEEKKSYNAVEIFPSPFRIPSPKPMTVNGLKDNSSLKIMTLNGKVLRTIKNSEVKGYQAYWDGRDAAGEFVGTGVYLIAIYDKKGASSFEKVAVIKE
ncbi:MAG: hypothetical protein QF842_03765 [Candidatus Marinimicrobia bacterium]|nr:hypothetical protein [Candidatus Neomarinimicrobiota bacterium]